MSEILTNYFKNKRIINISVQGKYTEDIPINAKDIQKSIPQTKGTGHIVFVVDTLSCDINAAFELTDWLLRNHYSWDTVVSGFSGSFGTVLSFGAQTIYLGTASFFMPIDATHPSHKYRFVIEVLGGSHHISRGVNPDEIEGLKNFMAEVFKPQRVPNNLLNTIHKTVPKDLIDSSDVKTKDIQKKLLLLSKNKNLEATGKFISDLTENSGSFDHFVNGKDFSLTGSNIVLIPSEVQKAIENSTPSFDPWKDLFLHLGNNEKEELYRHLSALSSIRDSLIVPIPSTAPFSFDLVCKIRSFLSQNLGTNQEQRKKLSFLLDSLGGNEPSAFLLSRVIKEFDPDFEVIVNRNARSGSALFVIGSPKIYVRKNSLFSYFDPAVEDMCHPGKPISESALRRVFLSPNLSDRQKESLFEELLFHVNPLRLGQVFRAGKLLRRFTTISLREKGIKEAEDIARSLTLNSFPHEYPLSVEEFSKISHLDLMPLDETSDNVINHISRFL